MPASPEQHELRMAGRGRPNGAQHMAGAPMAPPNQTLYVTNLPEKLRKVDLRTSLYMLFSTYGAVLDVVAMPNNKMRGQAWIAFKDVQVSTQAMRSLQGMDFFGRLMKISYAKGKSHAISKLDGTYRPPTAAVVPATTELQQQVFGNAPATANGAAPQGVKRAHEDEDEEVAMEEDSDAPMEEDSDDD